VRPTSALLGLLFVLAIAGAAPAAGAISPQWGWPTSGAHQVLAPFDPPAQPWLPGHRGVDLAADPGSKILAAGSGVVSFAAAIAGRGVVVIDHGRLRTTYEPVTSAVAVGDQVRVGTLIGHLEVDGSHCVTSCLHWGLLRGSDYLNPLLLVAPARIRLLPHLAAAYADAGGGSQPAERTGSIASADVARGTRALVPPSTPPHQPISDATPSTSGTRAVAAVGGASVALLAGAARLNSARRRRRRFPTTQFIP